MKMDKNFFKIQSFKEAANHQEIYQEMSDDQKENLFFHLMKTAYGFVGGNWPKMDKKFVKARTIFINEKNKN